MNLPTKIGLAAIATLALFTHAYARTEVEMIVDALPGSILISADLDSFEATGSNGRQEEASMVSAAPNFRMGLGFDMEDIYIDATAGAGILLNSRFRSFFLDANVGVNWEFNQSGRIGPHVGIIHFMDPSWFGDVDIEFEDETGFMAGVQMIFGYDVSFYFSVDYVSGDPDVSQDTVSRASANTLDFSGILMQFGVRGTF
jgi:hypothetical protein